MESLLNGTESSTSEYILAQIIGAIARLSVDIESVKNVNGQLHQDLMELTILLEDTQKRIMSFSIGRKAVG